MLIYVGLSSIIRLIPVDEIPRVVSTILMVVLMVFVQIISITVLVNIFLNKRKKYLLENINTENLFDMMCYFLKYDIKNDKSMLVSFGIVFIVNIVSISLTTLGDKFGGIAGIFFPLFSTQIMPMVLFGEELVFNIIGFILSSFLFLIIYYFVLTLIYKKSK